MCQQPHARSLSACGCAVTVRTTTLDLMLLLMLAGDLFRYMQNPVCFSCIAHGMNLPCPIMWLLKAARCNVVTLMALYMAKHHL